MKFTRFFVGFSLVSVSICGAQDKKRAPIPEDIPFLGGKLDPREEEPVFAVSSKQGMRILVSRDDGKTWEQTFLATEHREDGGWHGNFAVYGMACTGGVIGVFSGWGAPGIHIGSDDGKNWGYLLDEPTKLASAWDAAGGRGRFITSSAQWGDAFLVSEDFTKWRGHQLKGLWEGGNTHHMINGYGDYADGTFIVVGDNHHVFYSHDAGETWGYSQIPAEAGKSQQGIAYGNGVFLVGYDAHVARSEDGGKTWELREHGLEGRRAWRGLSFVKDQFWLTGRFGKHSRSSKEGLTWEDLPDAPGGTFVASEKGTLINVERGRPDILRSTDDGTTWETVQETPKDDVTWDMAFAVYGRVNQVK